MKITYAQNPLAARVELDDSDRALIRAKLYAEQLEEIIAHASHLIDPYSKKEGFAPDTVGAAKVLDRYFDLDENSERTTELLQYYEQDLLDTHMGDCTCFPASCSKCHAEDLLGIDTLNLHGKYIGKHEGSKCYALWKNQPNKTLDQAIEELAHYAPKFEDHRQYGWTNEDQFNHCVPRWTQEAVNLRDWLIDYRNTHFGEQA